MTLRPPAIAADIIALFAERGAEPVDIAILQPANPFLDMAGEDLRRRIFLTENETGLSLCLRPEFTIPVCLGHIA
jgi:ATP phosphoribosyltransferase regulatory subunit